MICFKRNKTTIFTLVFHRILDFKTGLDFYPGPFFMLIPHKIYHFNPKFEKLQNEY